MTELKKPEDFGIGKNAWNQMGLVSAVKWLFEKVTEQDQKITELKKS